LFYFEHKVTKAEALDNFSALGYLDFRPENKADCKVETKKQGKSSGKGSNMGAFCFKVRESNISLVFALPTADERDEWAYNIQEAIRGVNHERKTAIASTASNDAVKKSSRVSFVVIEMPKKSGQLKKMSGQKSKFKVTKLDTRWFRLEAGELKYYGDQTLKISKHNKIMSLKGASLSALEQHNEDTSIHLKLADESIMHIVAPSDVTAAEWRKAIGDSIQIISENEKDNNGKIRRYNLANIQDDNTPIKLDDKIFKNSETKATIKTALQKHFMLSDLTDYTPILDALQLQISLPGDVVIWQHSIGDLFYVLEQGQVEVIKNHQSVTLLPAGTAFGELALINDIARAASIRAYSVCHLWTINRKTLRHVLAAQSSRERQDKMMLLKNVPLFAKLNAKFGQIADVMQYFTFEKDARVIKQGDAGDFLYMIQSGSVVITKEGVRSSTELARLGAGQSFGELALLSNAPRAATITALEPLCTYTIDKATFNSVLGELAEAEMESMGIEILRKVKLLEGLSDKQLALITKNLTKVDYTDGEIIIQQGEEGETFYMISDGAVNVSVNHAQVAKLSSGAYFGELALMNDDRRNATISALGTVSCLTLGRQEVCLYVCFIDYCHCLFDFLSLL
jgi:CRP-like cAMP-binding protein